MARGCQLWFRNLERWCPRVIGECPSPTKLVAKTPHVVSNFAKVRWRSRVYVLRMGAGQHPQHRPRNLTGRADAVVLKVKPVHLEMAIVVGSEALDVAQGEVPQQMRKLPTSASLRGLGRYQPFVRPALLAPPPFAERRSRAGPLFHVDGCLWGEVPEW